MRPERSLVKIVSGADEADVLRDASRHLCLGGIVIDHDKGSANDEIIGDLGEYSARIE